MNPLHALHERGGAEFQPYADVPIVSTFGQPQAEYAAIHRGAAIMDQPYRGAIELGGKDRLSFLNGLLTNQTYNQQTKRGLAAGTGVYAFLLDVKGRIVSDMNVLELGDRTLLVMDARMVEPVMKVLEKYLFGEQVTMAGRVDELHHLFVTGPRALDVVNQAAAPPIEALVPLGSATTRLCGREALLYRDDACGVAGYGLICAAGGAEAIWSGLTPAPLAEPGRVTGAQARPVGWAAYNAARIEAGRGLFGIDFDNGMLPAETGQLARAVSFAKGCYLGQEIVARMHARGQLARQVVGIRMDGEALPIAGSTIQDEQQNGVGVVTSSTISPVLSNAAVCLGVVSRPWYAVGTRVLVPAEGAVHGGRVVAVPFVGGRGEGET